MFALAVVTCALLVAAPAPAKGGKPAPSALGATALERDPRFVDAKRLYDKFEFEKASFRFRALARATDLAGPDAARTYVWAGLALAQAGDEPAARDAFVSAYRRDMSVTLPEDTPPPLKPLFNEARATALAGTPTSSPSTHEEGARERRPPPAPLLLSTPPRTLATVGAALGGGGLVVVAAGAVVGGLALAQADDAHRQRFQDDALAGQAAAEGTALWANVLLVVGAACAVAGLGVAAVTPFVAEAPADVATSEDPR